jgi:hypothetical protein
MAEVFRDHPTLPGARIWRRSSWSAVGSAITLLLCVALVVMALAATIAGARAAAPLTLTGETIALGVGLVLFVVVMGAIAQLLWRDMRGKFGASITLTSEAITLRLPAGRSLIHDPPRCHMVIPWGQVKCIETRREVYGAQGMAAMNRVYRLRMHSGDSIFLFEQRGLRSNVETPSMQEVADEIAGRAGTQVRELGRYEGRGGVLAAWFARPPSWTAAPVGATRWATMQRRVVFTGSTIGIGVALVWLVRLLAVGP